MHFTDQPAIVADVLNELCQTRETLSAVTLAVDLVDRGRLKGTGDVVGLVAQVVTELGEAGLVTYRLRHQWADIPLHIRPTRQGYKIAGYEKETVPVGSIEAKHGAPRQKGPTDFRSQPQTTWGGPIERMSLADHLDYYPDHKAIHPAPWECGPHRGDDMTKNPETEARRRRQRVARIVDAVKAHGGTATFTQIQAYTSVGGQTMQTSLDQALADGALVRVGNPGGRGTYWRLPDQVPVTLSSRETILNLLKAVDRFYDDRDLMLAMAGVNSTWRSLGAHSLDHQLFSMQKAGLIEIDVKRNGSVQRITNIRLPKRQREREDIGGIPFGPEPSPDPVPVADGQEALFRYGEVDDVPSIGESLNYPILTSLRARAQARDETSRRVDAYLTAASALDRLDQAESDRLMAMASDLAQDVAITAIEAEYLRYAEMKEETNA